MSEDASSSAQDPGAASGTPNFRALLINDGGDRATVDVGAGGYRIVSAGQRGWRAATLDTTDAVAGPRFLAVGIDSATADKPRDGIVATATSSGRRPRSVELRLTKAGDWVTHTEERIRGRAVVRTRAAGVLGKTTQGISLERVGLDHNGNQAWSAQASVSYLEDGSHKTEGTISYVSGGTGEFASISNPRGLESSGGWKPIPAGPGATGLQKIELNKDGSVETHTTITSPKGTTSIHDVEYSGQSHWEKTTTTKTSQFTPTGSVNHETTKSQFFDHDVGKGETVSKTIETRDGVTTSEESRTVLTGDATNGGRVTSTTRSDGTGSIETLTWNGNEGSKTLTETDKSGAVVKEERTALKKDQGTWREKYSGEQEEEEKQKEKDSSSSDDDSSSSDNDDSDNGEQTDDSGSETESDDGSGDYGEDTGGPPGLSWDGQDNGPLSLLKDGGKSLTDGDDPMRELDLLGAPEFAALLVKALRGAAAGKGGSGGEGLGEDFGPEIDASRLTLTVPHSVAIDGEWGDFTNPKAHTRLVTEIETHLVEQGQESLARDLSATTLDHGLDITGLRTGFNIADAGTRFT
ncbi:hypothetical protein [Mycolicibacterium stellerae]|uniref:hypothetical protein n=1 Tax=Mycolicibacterium stellerae TaxID=2358193 RepID=UPI0013DE5BA9|nr:hypothetical protein [Mycolicibacterium stellerae]